MSIAPRWITVAAGVLGFTGVALGAFGAHALRDTLLERGTAPMWQTAVLYHLIHAVALLVIAGWTANDRGPLQWIARCWIVGIVLFSGSLYGMALGGPKFLGPITPLGGLVFLAGWLLIAWHAWKRPNA